MESALSPNGCIVGGEGLSLTQRGKTWGNLRVRNPHASGLQRAEHRYQALAKTHPNSAPSGRANASMVNGRD
jgi:hypothetical protein